MLPHQRSETYSAFAAAFRSPDGGTGMFDESIVPAAPENAQRAFMEAFEPAVSRTGVSLHASAHLERDQTDLYQELIRWYEHYGLKRRDGGELPDHLTVMLEFMQFLTAQEAHNENDADACSGLHAAQRDFITRHLKPLVQTLIEKSGTDAPRYKQLPVALDGFLADELAYLTS